MSTPQKDSPEWKLWIAALEVATSAPLTAHTPEVRVAWPRIERLRTALEALGVDWRTAKRMEEARDPFIVGETATGGEK